MTWGNPYLLYLLAVPCIGLIYSIYARTSSKRHSQLPHAKQVRAGFNSIKQISAQQRHPAKILFFLGLALLVVAVARPRWGTIERTVFKRSREVIVAIDLSKSMLAKDIKPNRLERAKLSVESLLDHLKGESVGLVVFAGSAFLQSPMSPDYQIMRGFIKDLNPSFVPQGGTDYGEMIKTALESFKQSDSAADRFLIVISDGESQDQAWKNEIGAMKEAGVKTICLGFGTLEGGLIPDGKGSFHKDSNGAVVLTKLESRTLESLANLTNGIYREANNWVDLAALIEETIKQGKAGDTGASEQSFEIERYQYFLGPGLLFILFSLYREFPSSPKPRKIRMSNAA